MAGRVVAKLPFEPPAFLQFVSHSGLEGTDATDCAFMFLYALGMMALRTVGSHWLLNNVLYFYLF
jgi:hypothetical protein